MTFSEFKFKLIVLESNYNRSINRKFGAKPFSKYPRLISHCLTWIFYKIGLRGVHILWTHAIFDFIAVIFVYFDRPLMALGFWFTSYIVDHCDGDLGRIRGEINLKWGSIDIHLHLINNMLFWLVLAVRYNPLLVSIILAGRVICEFHRSRLGEGVQSAGRWGEKSKFWHYLSLPTNVNIIYLSYVVFAVSGSYLPGHQREQWLVLYTFYYVSIAVGQSVVWMYKLIDE